MKYLNQSIFFIPIRVNSYEKTIESFISNSDWIERNIKDIKPSYLFPYATRIVESELCKSFSIRNIQYNNLYTYEDWLKLKCNPNLTNIYFTIFSTGIAFLEYRFAYSEDTSIDEILEFVYWFKKAKPKAEWLEEGKIGLFDYSIGILPKDTEFELFFANSAEFKYDCKCFHTIIVNKGEIHESDIEDVLHRLSRNYNSPFGMSSDISKNDMVYSPYIYDRWGGSPEGIANLVIYDANDKAAKFINGNMYLQLMSDHYFMYLFLLNQRYSLLNYLEKISINALDSKKQLEEIKNKSMLFDSMFSFRVISDDLLYQTIYSRMYDILDIEKLKEDTADNERIMETLLSSQNIKTEENVSKLLLGLSFLSLFSALIDASGFFDRIIPSSNFSTILSLICVSVIFAICIYRIIKSR